jgi:2-oxoglutarate dehydrogenase E1 component
LERFLVLAAENNLRVANCSTAANYFHLLRRQAALLEVDPLPLIVMTPKSLLRHPLVSSPLTAFTQGGWMPVIPPVVPAQPAGKEAVPEKSTDPKKIRRMILCSGKVYVDLITSELQPQHPEIAIARIEQLAPFPVSDVSKLLADYPALNEWVWIQEEPENMGPWNFCRPYLEQILAGRVPLRLISRPASSSPAEGSNNLHTYNQRQLVERAYAAVGEKNGRKGSAKTPKNHPTDKGWKEPLVEKSKN